MFRLIIIFSFLSIIYPADIIGVIIKSQGNIEYKKSSNGKVQQGLPKGTPLFNNDVITTKEDGFAIFLYVDDQSQVKVQKNTELVIRGAIEPGNIVKQINVSNGTVKANVKKQKGSDFTVVSPTSVAAVKGTEFWGVIDQSNGDKFCGLSGSVAVTNSITNQTVNLIANTTAISLRDGSLGIQPTQEGDLPQDQDPDGNGNGETEIRIPFQNDAGEQKELIIKIN